MPARPLPRRPSTSRPRQASDFGPKRWSGWPELCILQPLADGNGVWPFPSGVNPGATESRRGRDGRPAPARGRHRDIGGGSRTTCGPVRPVNSPAGNPPFPPRGTGRRGGFVAHVPRSAPAFLVSIAMPATQRGPALCCRSQGAASPGFRVGIEDPSAGTRRARPRFQAGPRRAGERRRKVSSREFRGNPDAGVPEPADPEVRKGGRAPGPRGPPGLPLPPTEVGLACPSPTATHRGRAVPGMGVGYCDRVRFGGQTRSCVRSNRGDGRWHGNPHWNRPRACPRARPESRRIRRPAAQPPPSRCPPPPRGWAQIGTRRGLLAPRGGGRLVSGPSFGRHEV